MISIVEGLLLVLLVITGVAAAVAAFLIGPVQALLCVVQLLQGRRPWRTVGKLLLGYAFLLSALFAAAEFGERNNRMSDTLEAVSLLMLAAICGWGAWCIVQACLTSRAEADRAAPKHP